MTKLEVARLLTIASMVDNRTVAPETVEAWWEVIGHLDFEPARLALVQHRRDSTEYLLPAHIVKGARAHLPELHARPDELFCPVHYGMPPRNCERCAEERQAS